jgi:hypothetical protein
VKGIWKGIALLQGEIIAKEKNTLKIFKNFLQNEQAKFNQTWYKLSLGEGYLRFFKERG